ncbi:MAG: hypothetical protein ABW168_01445 [Sedimenticola sp.]
MEKIKSSELLTYNRFDLSFKLILLEMMGYEVKFAKDIYREHIRAFSLGEFIEPGNARKNSIEKYCLEFEDVFKDINDNGFDNKKSIVPLSKNGSIANGSHRVASAIVLGKKVDCTRLETNDHIYDYNFFYKRNVPKKYLDVAASKFVEYADDVYIAIIWPTAVGHDKEIDKIITNVVYRKEVKLNSNGAHNLISQIYHGEKWLGTVENDFRGSKDKLVECFKTFGPVRVIAFQADNLRDVLNIKRRVRDIFQVGKHSIHITDNKREAVRVSSVIFNDNSIHMLNYSSPNKYMSTHASIGKINSFALKNNLSHKDFIVDSSMVLSVYGLREARDIDLLCSNNEVDTIYESINLHDDELRHYPENKHELIYNPEMYFYFYGIKFMSFSCVYNMKKNRNEVKDVNDIKMMEALIEGDVLKEYFSKIKQAIFYWQVRSRSRAVAFLKYIGVFPVVKKILFYIKGD